MFSTSTKERRGKKEKRKMEGEEKKKEGKKWD